VRTRACLCGGEPLLCVQRIVFIWCEVLLARGGKGKARSTQMGIGMGEKYSEAWFILEALVMKRQGLGGKAKKVKG